MLFHTKLAFVYLLPLLASLLAPATAFAIPPGIQNPALLSRPLSNYQFLDEAQLLSAYGIPQNDETKKEVKMLRDHLAGNMKDKRRISQACEKEFGKFKGSLGAPSAQNIGCLYWLVQKLRVAESKQEPKKLPLPKKKRDTSAAQRKAYIQKLKAIKTVAQAKKAHKKALENAAECKDTTQRSLLLRHFEDLLPQEEVWGLMTSLYDGMLPCLQPAQESYEIAHLRMGLLSLERGELIRATGMLELALRAVNPSEEYRTLFWRGFIEGLPHAEEGGLFRPHENRYWDRLVEKYPLTLHAIVADAAQNKDFFVRIKDRPAPKVSQIYGDDWNAFNYSAFIFAAMAAKKEKEAMRRFSIYVTDRVVPRDFETTLFFSLSHIEAGENWAGINTVFSGLRVFGAGQLSADVLKLLYPTPFRDEILKNSQVVDPALVFALIRQESTFNAKATSPVGAKGLMQVLDLTARYVMRKKQVDLYNPKENVQAGSRFLRQLLKRYDDKSPAALAAYNAGPTHVGRWNKRFTTTSPLLFSDLIPFAETRNYISGITRNMYWYQVFLNWEGASRGTLMAYKVGEPGLTPLSLVPKPEVFGIKPGISLPPNIAFDKRVSGEDDL